MKKTTIKDSKPEVGGVVLPKVKEPVKNVLTSISFDKNGNLYGVVDGALHRFDFATKTWELV
jgi:hypothetical protein